MGPTKLARKHASMMNVSGGGIFTLPKMKTFPPWFVARGVEMFKAGNGLKSLVVEIGLSEGEVADSMLYQPDPFLPNRK